MTGEQVHRIVSEKLFPGDKTGVSMLETHISWVVLSDAFAFKIKKPLRFDFLDFSTLERRKHFCEEELRLNRRLAPQMYLRVLPIGQHGIGDETTPVVDYALQMHRMDNSREMDRLLLDDAVKPEDMERLADLLAPFHLKNRLPGNFEYRLDRDVQDFADLFAFKSDLINAGVSDAALLDDWAESVPRFLNIHASRLEARAHQGFWIDGHGDLHSRNIFLPENAAPVVFDCLEFSAHFRQTDVLNELAFLCMDLEFYGRNDLSEVFLKAYTQHWPCFESPEDELLFVYFKAYRANVRLKVALLELRQHHSEKLLKTAHAYWVLLKRYLCTLTGLSV